MVDFHGWINVGSTAILGNEDALAIQGNKEDLNGKRK